METVALVTLYYPRKIVISNVIQLSNLVDKVVLLDNTPEISNKLMFNNINHIEYICYKENLGLSEAYNRYLNTVNGNCYIIFFDQDSLCQESLIRSLKKDYIETKRILGKKGIIGPSFFETHVNRLMIPKQKTKVSNGIYQVNSIITSGMFTELDVLKKINFWNKEIFLDLADWDICWRCLKNNLFCCLSLNTILTHSQGECAHNFVGFKFREGALVRTYYQTRDCLYLLRKKYVPIKFRIRFLFMLTVRPVFHFIYLPSKRRRLFFFFKGIYDFTKGIHGVFRMKRYI